MAKANHRRVARRVAAVATVAAASASPAAPADPAPADPALDFFPLPPSRGVKTSRVNMSWMKIQQVKIFRIQNTLVEHISNEQILGEDRLGESNPSKGFSRTRVRRSRANGTRVETGWARMHVCGEWQGFRPISVNNLYLSNIAHTNVECNILKPISECQRAKSKLFLPSFN